MSSQFLGRLRGRIKHGLLTQEILDRLGVLGIRFTPYLIVDESPGAVIDYEREISGCSIRSLDASEMHMVANMPNRKRDLEEVLSRLEFAECLGAFCRRHSRWLHLVTPRSGQSTTRRHPVAPIVAR